MKLNTVNVVEIVNYTPRKIVSFTDNVEGNNEAEKLFREIALDNGYTRLEILDGLDNGTIELGASKGYDLYIIHS